MTILDEPTLRRALCDAADSVPVPDRVSDVVAAARALERRGGPVRRLWGRAFHRARGPVVEGLTPRATAPRRVLVGAVSFVVLAGAVAAMATLGGSSNSAKSSSSSGEALGPVAHGPGANHIPNRAAAGVPSSGVVPKTAPAAPGATGPAGAPAQAQTGSQPPLPTGAVGQSSKVEESGSVDVSIGRGRLDDVVARLGALAAANGGFVADSQTQSAGGTEGAYGTVTLQVPEGSFASVVAQVQSLGTVTSLTTKGTDVTGQYVDLQSRVAALQASRDQYLTIMTKATSISDILAVQNQLDALQSQIEQLQGQLQVLDNETTYGTLAVSIAEPGHHTTPPPAPAPPSGIRSAWHGAVSGFTSAFDGLVRVTGPLLFVAFLLLALAVVGRIAWRTLRRQAL